MDIKFENINGTLIVNINGDIDHHNVSKIKNNIDEQGMMYHIKHIIFDFSKVSFMDSSGIGLIIGRYKMLKGQGGKVVVSSMTENAKKIFVLSGLHKIIDTYDDLDKAVQILS